MLRRGFLKALIAAPVSAPAAVAAAAQGIGTVGASAMVAGSSDHSEIVGGYSDPLREAFFDRWGRAFDLARELEGRRKEALQRPTKYLPYHIAEKRSWSAAFKHHCHAQENMQDLNPWSIDLSTPEGRKQALDLIAKMGTDK